MTLARLLERRGHRVEQQVALEEEDGAPILHRAEELALAGTRDQVEFGQGIVGGEIIVVIGKDLGFGVKCVFASSCVGGVSIEASRRVFRSWRGLDH